MCFSEATEFCDVLFGTFEVLLCGIDIDFGSFFGNFDKESDEVAKDFCETFTESEVSLVFIAFGKEAKGSGFESGYEWKVAFQDTELTLQTACGQLFDFQTIDDSPIWRQNTKL
jgi:hypothetical protein